MKMGTLCAGRWNRRRAISALALLAALPLAALSPAADEKPATVRLVIDYGDGAQVHFNALAWREGMTVLDALAAAGKHPHGITFVQRGTGASALITQIDDLKNQGDGKNWLYTVNGKLARVGAGGYELKPGDAILWAFKEYEYNDGARQARGAGRREFAGRFRAKESMT